LRFLVSILFSSSWLVISFTIVYLFICSFYFFCFCVWVFVCMCSYRVHTIGFFFVNKFLYWKIQAEWDFFLYQKTNRSVIMIRICLHVCVEREGHFSGLLAAILFNTESRIRFDVGVSVFGRCVRRVERVLR